MGWTRHAFAALAACAGFLLWGAGSAIAADGQDLVLRGDAKCTACHNQDTTASVLTIGQTKHGVRADGRTPTCTSCHGSSDRHVAESGGVKPDIIFAKVGKTGSEEQAGACLACHQNDDKRMHWSGSLHQTNDVTCSSCHTVHAPKDPVLSKVTQTQACYSCHKEQRAQMKRISRHPVEEGKVACSSCHNPHGGTGPSNLVEASDNETCYNCHKDKRAQMSRISHHPVPEGKLACSSCHNPHGGKGPSNLIEASVNETCYSCHAEKRGPFLIEHPPAREDCTTCHQPHGSNNAPLLKMRVPWLCQSCHFANFHPSTAYSGAQVPPNGVAQQLLAKGCANCHQQVHGSNHPSGWRWTR